MDMCWNPFIRNARAQVLTHPLVMSPRRPWWCGSRRGCWVWALLVSSKSFVDYSTSGLEKALLLFVLFLLELVGRWPL